MLEVHILKKLSKFPLEIQFDTDAKNLAAFGASGSGKSMLLKCISGLETPDSGRIVYNGKVLFDSQARINLPPRQRKIGYLFQNYALFPHKNVEENLMLALVHSNLTKQQKQDEIEQILQSMQLLEYRESYPDKLSGGQRQRIALARLIISKPDLILLDEPFSALDGYLKQSLAPELKNMLTNAGIPYIYVSHDVLELHQFCEEVLLLSNGKNEPITSMKQIYNHPQGKTQQQISEYIQQMKKKINLF